MKKTVEEKRPLHDMDLQNKIKEETTVGHTSLLIQLPRRNVYIGSLTEPWLSFLISWTV